MASMISPSSGLDVARSLGLELPTRRPRICWIPAGADATAGDEAVELAVQAGLELDDWQAFCVRVILLERPDGSWLAPEGGVCVGRQNGKGAILEALELAGVFLLGDELVVHSAHEFPTSLEAFRRMLTLLESNPDFDRRIMRVARSHGEEGIEFRGGQRIHYRTRTATGARGFTGDRLVLDEAMVLPADAFGTLLPTLSARPNPQVIYTGSSVDQAKHEHGSVFGGVRERALAGDDPGLVYVEYSPAGPDGKDLDVDETDAIAGDRDVWAATNPALDVRISREFVAMERRALPARQFAVERLNVGDWPATGVPEEGQITIDAWNRLADAASKMVDPVTLAFDVRPTRGAGAIAAAGMRRDELVHFEVVEHRRGTGWIVDRLAELAGDHELAGPVLLDGGSPAAALVRRLEAAKIDVKALSAREYAEACGGMFDVVDQATARHLGTQELSNAVKGARRRPLGDAWAWSRKRSKVDISPLVASALAVWGVIGPAAAAKPKVSVDDYRIGVL